MSVVIKATTHESIGGLLAAERLAPPTVGQTPAEQQQGSAFAAPEEAQQPAGAVPMEVTPTSDTAGRPVGQTAGPRPAAPLLHALSVPAASGKFFFLVKFAE